jgi:hypothetical protein
VFLDTPALQFFERTETGLTIADTLQQHAGGATAWHDAAATLMSRWR